MYEFVDTTEASQKATMPSEALKLNGEYIEELIPGYRTLYVLGRELLNNEIDTFETGIRDGSRKKNKRYPERMLTVGYQLITKTPEEYRSAYNKLMAILDVEDAELIFDDEPDYFFRGTPTDFGEVEPGRLAVVGEIHFLCTDPFKYSVVEYEAENSEEEPNTILIDYNGTHRSYPKLEAHFLNTEENPEILASNGDCGYVAFFNEEEKIIQIGDPDENDGQDAYAKSQTMLNQTYSGTGSWGSVSGAWKQNAAGEISGSTQSGEIGMCVASYAVPSNPKDTSATVLKNKATSKGAPIFYYTVTLKATGRTANSVKINAAITASLKYSTSYFGRPYALKGSLYIGGKWHDVTIKKSSEFWRGKSGHTANMSFTITGLSASTSSLSGIKFKVVRTDSTSGAVTGTLAETACSNLPISTYEADVPATYYLGAANYGTGYGYHGPSMTYDLQADSLGVVGAKDFTLSYKQKLCIGNGGNDIRQTGGFRMQLTDEHNKVIVGLHILKSRSGKTADMLIYINGVKVYAEEVDISYANKYFGVSGVQTSTIIKSGSKISFDIGGFKKTFSNSDIANVLIKNITFMFEKYGTSAQLSWNGVYWIKFIKNNCDTWIDIPNKFTANDILIADCKEGKIYLNDAESPQLGALGNDWEEFYLKPGLNQIGLSWSEWVPEGCEPSFIVKYREVLL